MYTTHAPPPAGSLSSAAAGGLHPPRRPTSAEVLSQSAAVHTPVFWGLRRSPPGVSLRAVLCPGALQGLHSQNALSCRCSHTLLSRQCMQEITGNNVVVLQSLLAEHTLKVSLHPHLSLTPTMEVLVLLRPYMGQPVLLVSDGPAPDGHLGWGAGVADHGGPPARCCGGAVVELTMSWGEKLAAMRLADGVEVPPELRRWAVANACRGSNSRSPSGASCVYLVPPACARAVFESA